MPNDGIDQDCDGSDLIVIVDNDGDGFDVDEDCDDNANGDDLPVVPQRFQQMVR